MGGNGLGYIILTAPLIWVTLSAITVILGVLAAYTGSAKCANISIVMLVIMFMYAGLIDYLDRQYTTAYYDTVPIVKLENVTINGANVVYIKDGAYTSEYYRGKITSGALGKDATVVRDVSRNMRGLERITLRDIVIPEGFIK